jgi:hypothetical protein
MSSPPDFAHLDYPLATQRTYFAHPISDYGTTFEVRACAFLEVHGAIIENPNQDKHQQGYAKHGMDYFVRGVLPHCDVCVFLAFPGEWIGAGVAMEVAHFLERKKPVFELKAERASFSLLPVHGLSSSRLLTRDETRGATRVLSYQLNGGRGPA